MTKSSTRIVTLFTLAFALAMMPLAVLDGIYGSIAYGEVTTWAKYYALPLEFESAQQTSDGGYIIASFGGLLKLDAYGNVEWAKALGRAVAQTADGGYVTAGYHLGSTLVTKMDSDGSVEWQKRYSVENAFQSPRSIQQTIDGGYIVGGVGDAYGPDGGLDALKIDSEGNLEWRKSYDTFGGGGVLIQQTPDGGFIALGTSGVLNDPKHDF